MKKIKVIQFLKNNLKIILTIIITALIAGLTTTFASYSYLAKDIEYTKNDGTKISVENALGELYNKSQSTAQTKEVSKTFSHYISNNYFYDSGDMEGYSRVALLSIVITNGSYWAGIYNVNTYVENGKWKIYYHASAENKTLTTYITVLLIK